MKRIFFILGVMTVSLLTFGLKSAQASTIFFDQVEDGKNGWTSTGLWHIQAHPEEISISSDFNPSLISLPDNGLLPEAYSGHHAWWYGSADDGTFIGDYNSTPQWDKNGGWSDAENSGDLVSPQIDLTDVSHARLTFKTWWEVEGVDVDRYDLMKVKISTNGGTTYVNLGNGSINPLNDVDGEAWKPYSSGGLGQVGMWKNHIFDLSEYAGERVVLKFTFDTVDEKYNAFRGWLLDDIRLDTKKLHRPTWKYAAQATRACSGGQEIQTPMEFYLSKDQTIDLTQSADAHAYITAFGSNDWVWDSAVNQSVSLTKGAYILYVDFLGNKGCPHQDIHATAHLVAGSQTQAVRAGELMTIYGSHFVSGATVKFTAYSSSSDADTTTNVSTQALAVSVVGSHEIHVVVPAGLDAGRYNITVTHPNGSRKTQQNALRVTTGQSPEISVIAPVAVNNDAVTELTLSGSDFDTTAQVTVGGVPLSGVTVDEAGTTITGSLPTGVAAGFQNVKVLNDDGQADVLVGGVEVVDSGADPFTPDGSFVGAPSQVTGVVVTVTGETSADVSWEAADRATTYRLKVVDADGKIVAKVRVAGLSRTLGDTYLDPGTSYRVRVRGVNTYGKGMWSDLFTLTTL